MHINNNSSTHPSLSFYFFFCTIEFTWLEAHSKGMFSNKVIKRHIFYKCCMYTFLLNADLNPKCTCIGAHGLNKWLFPGRTSKGEGIS